MTSSKSAQVFVVVIMCAAVYALPRAKFSHHTCSMDGIEYQVGESMSGGHPCQLCTCTPYGQMCSQMKCPTKISCVDKVIRNCCHECPNGNNCLYQGETVIPMDGCLYNGTFVCFCYPSLPEHTEYLLEPYCLVALPFEMSPPCIKFATP